VLFAEGSLINQKGDVMHGLKFNREVVFSKYVRGKEDEEMFRVSFSYKCNREISFVPAIGMRFLLTEDDLYEDELVVEESSFLVNDNCWLSEIELCKVGFHCHNIIEDIKENVKYWINRGWKVDRVYNYMNHREITYDEFLTLVRSEVVQC
jgi:hypothetical protein